MLHLFKVTEHSLTPEYQEGDFVITIKIPFFLGGYRVGDTVVFYHPYHGEMIKRIQEIHREDQTVLVIGTHPHSIDSRHFGPIPLKTIHGKVIWHIRKPTSE